MRSHGFDQMPVVSEQGDLVGVVTIGNITSRLIQGRANPSDSIEAVMFKQFKRVNASTTLGELSAIFDRDHFAISVVKTAHINSEGKTAQRELCTGVVTRIDLSNFITSQASSN